jgi:hypothetical protein
LLVCKRAVCCRQVVGAAQTRLHQGAPCGELSANQPLSASRCSLILLINSPPSRPQRQRVTDHRSQRLPEGHAHGVEGRGPIQAGHLKSRSADGAGKRGDLAGKAGRIGPHRAAMHRERRDVEDAFSKTLCTLSRGPDCNSTPRNQVITRVRPCGFRGSPAFWN